MFYIILNIVQLKLIIGNGMIDSDNNSIAPISRESIINFKLSCNTREEFKKIAHKNRLTMQIILESFVESYVKKPSNYKVSISMKRVK